MERFVTRSQLLFVVFVGIPIAPATASVAKVNEASVDAIVRKVIDSKLIPGAAVAVEENGRTTALGRKGTMLSR